MALPRVFRQTTTATASPDKTPLMESVDEVEAFYDDSRADMTRLLIDHQADIHRREDDSRAYPGRTAGTPTAMTRTALILSAMS
jgi:hypothetical protein